MNDEVLRTLIDETIARAMLRTRGVELKPGTVIDGEDPLHVHVWVDGDSAAPLEDRPDEDGIPVQSIIGALNPDDRVMLLFYPPSGCLIIGQILDTTWHEPTLLNSWVQTSFWTPVRYRKEPGNVVRLEGVVGAGTVGQPVYVLEEDYRPKYFCEFANDDSDAYGGVQVRTNGEVVPVNGNTRQGLFGTFTIDP